MGGRHRRRRRATGTAGARPDEARRHNRAALLRRLHVDGPCTRATLATELGLNRSTIKAVVDGLAEAGVVTEAVPAQRNGAGRPSLMVLPDPQAAVVLAVDVRVEQVAMAMVGIGGQMLGRHSWNLHNRTRTPGEVITHVAESAQLLAEELAVTAQGAGVSVPGVVRRADGRVHEAPNLGWRDVALGARLAAVLRMPVQVANDAELGALAEHVRGLGSRRRRPGLHLRRGRRGRRSDLRRAPAARHPRLRRRAGPPGGPPGRAAAATAAPAAAGRPRWGSRRCAGRSGCPRTPRAG